MTIGSRETGKLIFVTGYFGASIAEEAREIARQRSWKVVDLDAAIEKSDGRSIARLCMMGGEHAYRNAEFEQVTKLCEEAAEQENRPGRVVICGDGILHDEDTRRLILQHEWVITGEEQTAEDLWEHARGEEQTYHAFMKFGEEAQKRQAFKEHHGRQKILFAKVREEGAADERMAVDPA